MRTCGSQWNQLERVHNVEGQGFDPLICLSFIVDAANRIIVDTAWLG